MDPTVISMIESLITQKVEEKMKEAERKEEEERDLSGVINNDKPIDVEELEVQIDFSD